MTESPRYRWLVSQETLDRANWLLEALRAGRQSPSRYLAMELDKSDGWPDSPEDLLRALLHTKKPCIFAESAVAGDGSDWTAEEIALLGDIACLVPVTVFDDGEWRHPRVHEPPFAAHLVFVPGALLRDLQRAPSPDRAEIAPRGVIDPEAHYRLHERRLRPVFDAIEAVAVAEDRGAVVTMPGLGCGQFAGAFGERVKPALRDTLHRLLEAHAARWPHLRLVHFDPYAGIEPYAWRIRRDLVYRVRPLTGGHGHPQLSRVAVFDEGEGRLGDCRLFSLVAWDHISWPGNDFYAGSRYTDDGVKAAATDSMYRMTGIAGKIRSRKAQIPATRWFLHLGASRCRLRYSPARVRNSGVW